MDKILTTSRFDGLYLPKGLDELRALKLLYDAIGASLESSYSAVQEKIAYLDTIFRKDCNNPPDVDYNNMATIDAYTAKYMPRYFHLPKLAIRSLLLNSRAFILKDKFRIMDIGSGTGAISLGLYHIFSRGMLSKCSLDITAIDECQLALNRQEQLKKLANFSFKGDKWNPIHTTISPDNLKDLLKGGDWDYIFAANIFNELPKDVASEIILLCLKAISKQGAVIIFDIQHDRIKKLVLDISNQIRKKGGTIYYPCRHNNACYKNKCWMWNEYYVKDLNIKHKDGVIPGFNNYMKIFMLIINKNGYTIYDDIKNRFPSKNIGVGRFNSYNERFDLCDAQYKLDHYEEIRTGAIYAHDKNGFTEIIRI
jgi:SAM-dependent methyltransferase